MIKINQTVIGHTSPTYFIADIAANHNGDLILAKELIHSAAENGANAAKFQHFKASTIVSNKGFNDLGGQFSHQSSWKKSVYEVYDEASINLGWTSELKEECDKVGVAFFTSPYSIELVDYIDPFVPAYKIGSGDITWHEIVEHIASKGKPYLIATGASNQTEIDDVVQKALNINRQLAILQCNTNYTASAENFRHINLNVLKTYQEKFPEIVCGLSDHTPGHATVLGAVTLGARIIEKHYTMSNDMEGPDHKFSMTPSSWRDMVLYTRDLELALGSEKKKIEQNELETAVLQRRAIRVKNDLSKGHRLKKEDLIFLRPCEIDAIPPFEIDRVIGKVLIKNITKDSSLKWDHLESGF